MQEPGLDRYEWETEWEALEPLLADEPAETLPELHNLISRMMEGRGFSTQQEESREAAEPEVAAEFIEAQRIPALVEAGEAVDPGDVGAAVTAYRTLYDHLLDSTERRSSLRLPASELGEGQRAGSG